MNAFPAAVVVAAVAIAAGCATPPTGVPPPGGVAANTQASGHVLVVKPRGGLDAIALPGLATSEVLPGDSPSTVIHAVSGPDANGLIVYIEDEVFAPPGRSPHHQLRLVHLDGTGRDEIFSRAGRALWATTPAGKGEVGSHLALSPSDGLIAVQTDLVAVQMPAAYLHSGRLEIWHTQSRLIIHRARDVLDEGFAWFPDAQHLVFSRLVDPALIPDGEVKSSFAGWPTIPAVFLLDVHSGAERLLAAGWRPTVSGDGSVIAVADRRGHHHLVPFGSTTTSKVRWPGAPCTDVLALLSPSRVIARCPPGPGEVVEFTRNNSPLSGPKPMSALKVVHLDSGQSATLVPHVDPRTRVSVGVANPAAAD